jgi:hypothetical protein
VTSSSPPAQRSGNRGFVVAGALTVAAVLVAAVMAVIVARAIAGYTISVIPTGQDTVVTLGDRDTALWIAPDGALGSCTATLEGTETSTLSTGGADLMVTDGGITWSRVGVVHGDPGTRHTVLCSGGADVQAFGTAPNPHIARYVVMGGLAAVLAGLLLVTAFVIALVTALRRSRARQRA